MRRIAFVLAVMLMVAGSAVAGSGKDIVAASGVKGGVIVHIGCGDGKLTAELRVNDRYLVHGLDTNPVNVDKAREYLRSHSKYGKVSAARLTGSRLPYTDNLVNLIVSESPSRIAMAEMMRVLAPGGATYLKKNGKWTKTVKPRPGNIDEWTHFLHGPDNNAVAADSVA
ncbi:MAG: class I SAM-dependent methyltransferase, partial [Planctomycetes bacterium]|nr:class I SAM-dependent methyltransferase [Planctomycetota bacterium]